MQSRQAQELNTLFNSKYPYNNSGVQDNGAQLTLTGTTTRQRQRKQKTRTKIQTELTRERGTGETQREPPGWGTHKGQDRANKPDLGQVSRCNGGKSGGRDHL